MEGLLTTQSPQKLSAVAGLTHIKHELFLMGRLMFSWKARETSSNKQRDVCLAVYCIFRALTDSK